MHAVLIGEMIEAMLVLGRAVEAEMRRIPIDVTAIATEVVAELREDPDPRCSHRVALGDPVLIRAVLTNLLSNAWKFTSRRREAGARIEVGECAYPAPTTTAADGEAGPDSRFTTTFFVRDNGAGFDMAHAKKLFGVFQRLAHQAGAFPALESASQRLNESYRAMAGESGRKGSPTREPHSSSRSHILRRFGCASLVSPVSDFVRSTKAPFFPPRD